MNNDYNLGFFILILMGLAIFLIPLIAGQ